MQEGSTIDATELGERMGAVIADVVADAILKGIDPHQHITDALDAFEQRWPRIAGLTRRALESTGWAAR